MHAAKHRPMADVCCFTGVFWIGAGKRWNWVIALKANYPTPKSRSLTDSLLRNILAALQELALLMKLKMTEKEKA